MINSLLKKTLTETKHKYYFFDKKNYLKSINIVFVKILNA